MIEHKKTEEEQKDLIFDIFTEWHNSANSDRTQTYFLQLCEQIYKWYKDYPSVKANNMGLEITNVVDNLIKKDKKLNLPKDKEGFFKYLNKMLSNEEAASYHRFDETKIIKITKYKIKKLRDLKILKESQLGKELTNEEQIQITKEFFKEQEYIDLLKNVGSLWYTSNDGEDEIDALDYVDPISDDPQFDEYIKNLNIETELEAVKSVLGKKQERSRDCYRALFTLFCVKNNLRGLYSILDQEVIDAFYENDKKPKQYEIYLKYHPETDKKSAEAMASKNLAELLNEIETCLKEKNQ